MNNSPPRILFLSHSASRNGASILLAYMIEWLKTHMDCEIEVLVNGKGPLLSEFCSSAKTIVLRNTERILCIFPRHLKVKFQQCLETQYMRALLSGRRFDLIYANTSAIWSYALALAPRNPALLWHIHELEYALRFSIGKEKIKKIFKIASRFVAVSTSVRDMLVGDFKVPNDKVDIVHGFIPFPKYRLGEQRSRRQRVRSDLHWREDAFVVGGCGSLGWRKGTDLFLQIALNVIRTKGYENVRFLWVGGGINDKESMEFDHDISVLGLNEYCYRIPNTDKVADFFCTMDVFALTSREDPYPLVMLEAGVHGVPVVCFESSGGGPEFVGEDSGLIAPYLGIHEFAANIMKLYNEPKHRDNLGAAALNKVLMQHGVETQGPKIMQCIYRCLHENKKNTNLEFI